MRREYSLLFALLLPSNSALALDVKVEPPNPEPGQIFRLSALVPVACEKIKKIELAVPANLSLVGESKADKGGGSCLVVKVLSAGKKGEVAMPSLKVTAAESAHESAPFSLTVGQAAAAAPVKDETELKAFIEKSQNYLANYVVGGIALATLFSLEACRAPATDIVKVLLDMSPVHVHVYKFIPGCDAEGKVDFRLGTPVQFDLKLRNLGGIDRVKGLSTIYAMKSKNAQMHIRSKVDEGEAYSSGRLILRFSMKHSRTVGLDMASFNLTDLDNSGVLTVTEFQGKKLHFDHHFTEQAYVKTVQK